MKTFVTADLHFGHGNIIRHCERPFSDRDQMDNQLVTNWNSVVKPHDRVIVVGDFAWKRPDEYLRRLNGSKILIRGNHDYRGNIKGFEFIKDIWDTKIEGQRVVFCHYQLSEWNASYHGSWHLYGHSHGNAVESPIKLSFDVGTDLWNYRPIEWEQIQAKMEDKERARKIHFDRQNDIFNNDNPHGNRIINIGNNMKYWRK